MRLVYLSPVPWHSFDQRPHKFVEWFHLRTGEDVLWVDPYPGRLPVKTDFRRAFIDIENKKEIRSKSTVPSWLHILNPNALPVEPIPGSGFAHRALWFITFQKIRGFIQRGECMLGLGKPSKMAVQLLEIYPSLYSFYDAMDDFPAVHSGVSSWSMKKVEQKIVTHVSKLMVSSTNLSKKYLNYQSKTTIVLNACMAENFPCITTCTTRAESTILGYVGTISHWFDWSLVCDIASSNSSAIIRLIGPVMLHVPNKLPDNIELLPACTHQDAICAMQEFTVGLIPFKQTRLTDSVDPIKYYEYKALGLPVFSTSFGEMAFREKVDGVYFFDTRAELDSSMQKAMKYKCDIREVADFRKNNSWVGRFDSSGLLE